MGLIWRKICMTAIKRALLGAAIGSGYYTLIMFIGAMTTNAAARPFAYANLTLIANGICFAFGLPVIKKWFAKISGSAETASVFVMLFPKTNKRPPIIVKPNQKQHNKAWSKD